MLRSSVSSLPVVSGEVATDGSIVIGILDYGGPYWDRTSLIQFRHLAQKYEIRLKPASRLYIKNTTNRQESPGIFNQSGTYLARNGHRRWEGIPSDIECAPSISKIGREYQGSKSWIWFRAQTSLRSQASALHGPRWRHLRRANYFHHIAGRTRLALASPIRDHSQ